MDENMTTESSSNGHKTLTGDDFVDELYDEVEEAGIEEFGIVKGIDLSPESGHWEDLERYVGTMGGDGISFTKKDDIPNHIVTAAQVRETEYREKKKEDPELKMLDSRIDAMMQLASYMTLIEGDLWQAVVVPMSIGLTEPVVKSADEGIQREFRNAFDAVNMRAITQSIWLSTETFGVSYPLEFWKGKEPQGVSTLNPRSVVVDPFIGVGEAPMYFAPDSSEAFEALGRDNKFLKTTFTAWNDRNSAAESFQMKQRECVQISALKYDHTVYAIPPVIRAMRSVSVRLILESMVRSTVEGVKNQIFLYKLKDAKKGERQLLERKLRAARGDRTGSLVWKDNLEVDYIHPASIDALLGNETWMRLTLDIMRKLGVVMRTLSGEVNAVGAARDFDIDLQIFLDRQEIPRQRINWWLNRWCRRYAKGHDIDYDDFSVGLAPVSLATVNKIKNVLAPLLNYGLPSITTALEMAGLSADSEIAMKQKERELGIDELFTPMASFAQMVKPEGGSDPEKKKPTNRKPKTSKQVQKPKNDGVGPDGSNVPKD